jgi:hypothetical protein
MCGVCIVSSVHKISDWCVESVWRYLYTSWQTDVWSLYGHNFTQVIRLMCGASMETSAHHFSEWCLEYGSTHLYTSCQRDVCSLCSDICTPDTRLMFGVCMETSVHKNISLMWGVSMETHLHQLSDWCVDSVWTHHYNIWQTDVWCLYLDINKPVVRVMCGYCMETFVHLSTTVVEW